MKRDNACITLSTVLTCKLKFLASLNAGISTNSKRNCCGKPPSKPASHSTCSESLDWFDTEQFCSGNGRPANKNSSQNVWAPNRDAKRQIKIKKAAREKGGGNEKKQSENLRPKVQENSEIN